MNNHMYHNVFATQQRDPSGDSVIIIMNDLATLQGKEGDLIPDAGTESRYLETPFLSTDETDPDFLVPNWSSELVKEYVVDAGWPDAGIKDPDGSAADLGAVPSNGGRPVDVVVVRPTQPVVYANGKMNLSFSVNPRIGTMTDPKIVFLRLVRNLDTVSNFGNDAAFIKSTQIQTVPIPANAVQVGVNEYQIDVPDPGVFAFFELFIEGTGSDQKKFTTSAGLVSYRKIDYRVDVTVIDATSGEQVTEVLAGTPVVLRATPVKATGAEFTNIVDPTDIRLYSGGILRGTDDTIRTSFPDGIQGVTELEVIFTRVPENASRMEYVGIAGKWIDASKVIAFLGSSDGVKILPGFPERIAFQDPPSGMYRMITTKSPSPVLVQLFDTFGNKADAEMAVLCESSNPAIGDVVNKEDTADGTGAASFYVQPTNGVANDTFALYTTFPDKNVSDTTFFVIGTTLGVARSPDGVKKIMKNVGYELVDLQGRVVWRETTGRNVPLRLNASQLRHVGYGMYLLRTIDVTTGKSTLRRRIVVGR